MAFEIIEEFDELEIGAIQTVIFGDPGIGKTTLAFTSDEPVLMDFDRGVHRAGIRKKAVKFENWSDAVSFLRSGHIEDQGIKTIIIDTAGTMLDNFMADHVIKENVKNGKSGGGLSLQGYGALKEVFKSFSNECRSKNLDVVYICHSEEKTKGDDKYFQPKMTGSSYDILMSFADLVGFMYSENNEITLDFNPTDSHRGKNSAGFDVIKVPNISHASFETFLRDLLVEAKHKMKSMSDSQKKALELLSKARNDIKDAKTVKELIKINESVKESPRAIQLQVSASCDNQYIAILQERLQAIDNVDDINDITEEVKNEEVFLHLKKHKSVAVSARAKELGYEFDKELECFVNPNPSDEEGEKEQAPKEEKEKPEEEKPKATRKNPNRKSATPTMVQETSPSEAFDAPEEESKSDKQQQEPEQEEKTAQETELNFDDDDE